jgi:hypothetical protein
MSNVLSEQKKQQVIALGKLGWPLRHIEQATSVRRETASAYLKAAGVVESSVRAFPIFALCLQPVLSYCCAIRNF